MPAHFKVATHSANPVSRPHKPLERFVDIVIDGNPYSAVVSKRPEVLQSSFNGEISSKDGGTLDGLRKMRNGFVDTVMEAYSRHHHLVLRPDDVWIAILGQFNIYINKHAEELRSHFVTHEGQETLTIQMMGNRHTVDFGGFAKQMTEKIHANVVDKELKSWILPDFSTTTNNDTVICSVMMMSTLKAYFNYEGMLRCGIPSVTLLGEESDWESLLLRLDKLPAFGPEPTQWASLLRPILKRFICSFIESSTSQDGSVTPDTTTFWNKVCDRYTLGSGPIYLSGWITAFCIWDKDGNWMGRKSAPSRGAAQLGPPQIRDSLILDKVAYPTITTRDVPTGGCRVDVRVDDNGEVVECEMVAGLLGMGVEGVGRDNVRPLPVWFMLVKGDETEGQAGGEASTSELPETSNSMSPSQEVVYRKQKKTLNQRWRNFF